MNREQQERERAEDVQALLALDMIEGDGLSYGKVARRVGGTRALWIGKVARILKAVAASEAAGFAPGQGPAVRPENRDGALGRLWWV